MTTEVDGRVRTVFEVSGQDQVEQAAKDVGEALGTVDERAREASAGLGTVEEAGAGASEGLSSVADVATQSAQETQILQQRLQALAGGLSGLAGILGTESDTGALVGRMGQFASVGLQLGTVFGPTGAVVGGILGATVPALLALSDELTGVSAAQDAAADFARQHADELAREAREATTATTRLGELTRAMRARRLEQTSAETLQRLEAGDIRSADDARLRAEMARQEADRASRLAPLAAGGATLTQESRIALENARMTAALGGIFQASVEDTVASLESFADRTEEGGSGSGRGGRGGGARDTAARDKERARDTAARDKERRAEMEFQSILAEIEGRRYDAELERREAEAAHMREMLELAELGEKRKREESERVAREYADTRAREAADARAREAEERRVDAQRQARVRLWRGLSEEMASATLEGANAIGGAFAGAFEQAITGQESFDVAFAKGAKQALIQFGTGQVAEGIGALLTAAGNIIINPPAAATKAVEGAGKIALGVSLGAAGAAISVPAGAGASADRAPRLGPSESDRGSSSAPVIVNLNAPSIVTHTRASLGRELGRTLDASQRRFGRAAA